MRFITLYKVSGYVRALTGLGVSLMLFILLSSPALAEAERVRVGLTTTDYSPYWKVTPDKIEGLVVDSLYRFFDGSQYQLEIVPVPRKRIDQSFEKGEIDLRVSDIRWMSGSHPYKASDVFMPLEDVYWSRNIKYLPHPAKVCAVLGFIYSAEFDRKIADGSFIRVNVTHPTQSFQMLAYERCDLAISDSRLGAYIVKRDRLEGKVKKLNWQDRSWQLRFIAQPNKKGEALVRFINEKLRN